MAANEPADDEAESEFDYGRDETVPDQVPEAVTSRAKNGTLALVAGGLMLARAVRALRWSRGRAAVRAVAGAGLVAVGLRQRRSASGSDRPYASREGTGSTDVTISERIRDESDTEPTDEGTTGEFGSDERDVGTGHTGGEDDEPGATADEGYGDGSGTEGHDPDDLGPGDDESGDHGVTGQSGETGADEKSDDEDDGA